MHETLPVIQAWDSSPPAHTRTTPLWVWVVSVSACDEVGGTSVGEHYLPQCTESPSATQRGETQTPVTKNNTKTQHMGRVQRAFGTR